MMASFSDEDFEEISDLMVRTSVFGNILFVGVDGEAGSPRRRWLSVSDFCDASGDVSISDRFE